MKRPITCFDWPDNPFKLMFYYKWIRSVKFVLKPGKLLNATHKQLFDRYSSGSIHHYTYTINVIGTHRMLFFLEVYLKQK